MLRFAKQKPFPKKASHWLSGSAYLSRPSAARLACLLFFSRRHRRSPMIASAIDFFAFFYIACGHVCGHALAHVRACVGAHVKTRLSAFTCGHFCRHVGTHACTHSRAYVCAHACIRTCMRERAYAFAPLCMSELMLLMHRCTCLHACVCTSKHRSLHASITKHMPSACLHKLSSGLCRNVIQSYD